MIMLKVFTNMKQYKYVSLAELDELSDTTNENFKVNIYALVVDVKIRSQPTSASEDTPVITQLELRDRSSDISTTCVIYSDSVEGFSDQIQNGQIIRMHRAKIKKNTDGKLVVYGKLKVTGFAVLLFSGELGDTFAPVYQSSATFTLVSNYEEMISSLRMLSVSNQLMTIPIAPLNSNLGHINEGEINEIIKNVNVLRLNELVLGGYGDIVVQAVSLFIDDRNCVILRCWDTTLPSKKIFMFNDDVITEVIYQDEKMEMIPIDYCCDIVLYEEHANFARNSVKCGDVLLLINTHLYYSKDNVTLVMHNGGQHYNRSIVILDANSNLKRDLLRNIDDFNTQIDTEDRRNVEDIEQHPYTSLQQVIPTPSLDELNDFENEQRELWKYWAGERMRQIHALQLAWIYAYACKKKENKNAQLQRPFHLATTAVQFIVQQTLKRLFRYNKDLFVNFTKLSRNQRNTILKNFLLTYMEGVYDDGIILKLTNETTGEDKQSDNKDLKVIGDENSSDDYAWNLLCNLLPGTILKFSSWQVTFSYNEKTKILFVLICHRCNLWCTTSAKNFDMTPLCPVCFKRGITDSHLFLQCYFLFSGIPRTGDVQSKKYYFLLPIQLLNFFLVDVPESPLKAARNYRKGISSDQKKALTASIQEKMLSKYSFALNEVIVRIIKADVAILEVGKLTFADR